MDRNQESFPADLAEIVDRLTAARVVPTQPELDELRRRVRKPVRPVRNRPRRSRLAGLIRVNIPATLMTLGLALVLGLGAVMAGPGALAALAQYGPPPLTITTTTLPCGVVGSPYSSVHSPLCFPSGLSSSVTATGGTPPYSFAVTSGVLPTPLTLDPTSGSVSGVPIAAGTSDFTVTVTDASVPAMTATAPLSITVEPSHSPPSFTPQYGGAQVIAPPHVAFVLVGNWWCDLFTSNAPSACRFGNHYPFTCKMTPTDTAPTALKCLAEASAFLSSLNNLVLNDYNDCTPAGYDYGLAEMLGNSLSTGLPPDCGLQLRSYTANAGAFYAGPVNAVTQNTLNSFAGGFGITTQADVADTVFVLLYAPKLLPGPSAGAGCNPSANGQLGGSGRNGLFGNFIVASVYLEDYTYNCTGAPGTIPGRDFNLQAPTAITPEQFATFAASHEIDEALTDPINSHTSVGWIANGRQIADDCATTDGNGTLGPGPGDGPGQQPYWNFTRDDYGTVVAAYASPYADTCEPAVDTAVPPK